jgi:hypothetical protein
LRCGTSLRLALLIGALALLAAGGWPGRAVALQQPALAVMTLVDADGRLLALPEGRAPVVLHPDLSRGGWVEFLAWHPKGREVLLVAERNGSEREVGPGPYSFLLRLDLSTDSEQELLRYVQGVKGALGEPHYGPGGDWVYIQEIAYSGGGALRLFESGARRSVPSQQFLEPTGLPSGVLRDVDLAVLFGPAAPDGRVLTGVNWFARSAEGGRIRPSSTASLPDLEGLYLVDRDMARAERLTHGPAHGPVLWPLGLGPDQTWVAGLRCDRGFGDCALALVDLPSGAERTLLAAGELPGACCRGAVGPDGTIAVASQTFDRLEAGDFRTWTDLWLVNPVDNARRNLTHGAFAGFTAFAWAPSHVLEQLMAGEGAGGLPGQLPAPAQAPRR